MGIKNYCKISYIGLFHWIHHECQKKITYATSLQQAIIPIIISVKDSIIFFRMG